jgi:hypothetical protein
MVVTFDCYGDDEWMEFGGNWWSLDLDEETEPKYELRKLK